VVERDTFRNDLVVVRDRFPTDALCWTCVSRSAATESPRRRPQPIMTQPWRRVLDPQHGAAARVVGLTPPVVIAVLLIMIGWWLDSASIGARKASAHRRLVGALLAVGLIHDVTGEQWCSQSRQRWWRSGARRTDDREWTQKRQARIRPVAHVHQLPSIDEFTPGRLER
jgi:hypothetical protein